MAKPNDFSAKLRELEAITTWFESDEVDLNEAIAKFERGMQLAGELKQELGQLENRVEKIKAKFDVAAEAEGEAGPALPPPDTDGGPTLF